MKNFVFIVLFASALNSFSQTLTTSLTACYDLNGNASEPVNSLTGTLSATTPTVDRFNNASSALQFNGTIGSYVELPEDPLLKPSPAISFALWVKAESLSGPGSGGKHIVFTKNNQSSNFEAYQFEIFNGTFWRLNKANSTLNNIVLSTSTVVLNQWTHIACTIDNTSLKLYVNAVMEASTSSTFNGFDYQTGKKVILGGTTESFNHPFQGALDNLKFWNRVLTQAEVTQLFQTDPACSPGGAPTVAFIASTNATCVGSSITFSNTSSNNPTAFNWQLTGPAAFSSTQASPVFTFNSAGVYSVNLTASNSNGSNTAAQTLTIHPNPSVTVTSSSNTVCAGNQVTLQATGAGTYSWSSSQSSASIQVSPTVNTVYTVQGKSTEGCMATTTIAIAVVDCNNVSLIENSLHSQILCFPNPVRNVLHLKGQVFHKLSLFNAHGRHLMYLQLNPGEETVVDLSEFEQGLYFLNSDNTNAGVVRLVIE